MKKISIVSGCFVLILVILFLTGTIDLNNDVKQSINQGNKLFDSEKYFEALITYEQGIEVQPEDERLNYNAAQTGYCLGTYQQAIQYYEKAANDFSKYINLGNANLKLGDSSDDETQKLQFYQKAVESYKNGIISYPQNVEIKYNYEVAKTKLDELSQNLENQEDQQQDQQQEDQDQEKQEGDQDNQSEDNNSSDESQQQENEEQEEQGQSNESQETDDDEQANESSQSMSESEQNEQNQAEQEIAQILDMLEKQEQDSLKNNQEVKEANTEEENEW